MRTLVLIVFFATEVSIGFKLHEPRFQMLTTFIGFLHTHKKRTIARIIRQKKGEKTNEFIRIR